MSRDFAFNFLTRALAVIVASLCLDVFGCKVIDINLKKLKVQTEITIRITTRDIIVKEHLFQLKTKRLIIVNNRGCTSEAVSVRNKIFSKCGFMALYISSF